jgi:hypothetical protein
MSNMTSLVNVVERIATTRGRKFAATHLNNRNFDYWVFDYELQKFNFQQAPKF